MVTREGREGDALQAVSLGQLRARAGGRRAGGGGERNQRNLEHGRWSRRGDKEDGHCQACPHITHTFTNSALAFIIFLPLLGYNLNFGFASSLPLPVPGSCLSLFPPVYRLAPPLRLPIGIPSPIQQNLLNNPLCSAPDILRWHCIGRYGSVGAG